MKQKHYTPQELMAQAQLQKIIDAEVKRQSEAFTMTERVVRAIRATHKADMMLGAIVLLDVYDASQEFIKEYLDKWTELLHQYNDGTVQMKQLEGHIKVRTGVDIMQYCENNMDFAEITEAKSEELRKIIDGARVDDAVERLNKSRSAGGNKP